MPCNSGETITTFIIVNILMFHKHKQVIMGRNSLLPVVYSMTSGNHFVDILENNIINDSVQIEVPKQVMDVLRTCVISNWTSEPYHQKLNLVEWKYRTIKLWTNIVMSGSDTPSNHWLLCIIDVCYLLNHIACSKDSEIPVHSLTTDGGECGSPSGHSEGLKLKIIATKFPMASSDPDVTKIHLHSSHVRI